MQCVYVALRRCEMKEPDDEPISEEDVEDILEQADELVEEYWKEKHGEEE